MKEQFKENLKQVLYNAYDELFNEAELFNFLFYSLKKTLSYLLKEEKISLKFPIGVDSSNNVIMSEENTYSKEEITKKFKYLAFEKLALNSIYRLVSVIELCLHDIMKTILVEYPKKVSSNKDISATAILSLEDINDVKNYIIDNIINSFFYKSPREYIKDFEKYTSIKLTDCIAFNYYFELKATRDIYIHNEGLVNDLYLQKADKFSREKKKGKKLIVDNNYFLNSYGSTD